MEPAAAIAAPAAAADAKPWRDIVLDTSAFLQSEVEVLRKQCENLWTIDEVLNEVRDDKSKAHLDFALLTTNVRTRRPKPESLEYVIAFARKTGDFPSLSKTDLLVIALTHELRGSSDDAGSIRALDGLEVDEAEEEEDAAPPKPVIDMTRKAEPGKSWASVLAAKSTADKKQPVEEEEEAPVAAPAAAAATEDWPSLRVPEVPRQKIEPPPSVYASRATAAAAAAAPVEEEEDDDDEEEEEEEAPPPPVNDGKSRILSLNPGVSAREEEVEEEEDEATAQEWAKPGSSSNGWAAARKPKVDLPVCQVGCSTADFALQNVLLQLRLGVVALDGRRILTVKSWVLKCDGCLAIVPATQQRLFCPKCGHASLARLAYTINPVTGQRRYHYAKNRRIRNKGNRFPIPKNADLLLREDQLLGGKWAQRAQAKTSAESQWGRDVNDALGLGLKAVAKMQHAYGTQNPNAAKGRERRGAAKKKQHQH